MQVNLSELVHANFNLFPMNVKSIIKTASDEA